nr:sensor histidine kinase [Tamlana sargassicola]
MDSSFALYTNINNEKGIASSHLKLAVYYRLEGEYEKGLNHIKYSIDYAEKTKDTFNIANSLFQKAVLYSLKSDYNESLEVFYKILAIYEAMDNQGKVGLTLNSIGITYNDLQMYPEAINAYKKAVSIHEKMQDSVNLPNAYSNLALAYANQKQYDLALNFYRKARQIDINTNNEWGLGINSENIGVVLNEQEKYTDAIIYFNEAKRIFDANNFKTDLTRVYTNLGQVNFRLKNYIKSEFYLKEALKSKTNSKLVTKEIHNNLFELYKATNRYELALDHYEKFNVFKDSIFEEERIKNINELDKKYQTEKKDKEIATQQLEIQNKEAEIEKKQTLNIIAIGSAIFLLIAAILIVFIFKQRQKRIKEEVVSLKRQHQIKTLEALIEGEENERFRIARELHDGVNGDLSAIKYKLSSLLEMNNKIINEAITMIDDSCKQVRAISHDLVPPSLESFSLVEATEAYCSNLNEAYNNIDVNFQHLGEDINLSKKNEINIFRIIQELVSNSLKHAQAKAINVQISHRNNQIQITVEDDGVGFNANEVSAKGIGLGNVKSRVDYLNATLDLISNQSGTSYTIDIDTKQIDGN